jgi:hypothetical protein
MRSRSGAVWPGSIMDLNPTEAASEVLPAHIRLEPLEHIPSASAMHLRYKVVRPS